MPFEENLQAHLIRALGRSGRRRDAMTLYEQVRHGLAEELGVDPGEELRATYQDLLADGSWVAGRVPVEVQGSAQLRHPAELPARVFGFAPRPEAQRLLNEIASKGEAGAVLITAIGGMGGIGKTALAVAWARDLADRFPDGQLYVNLRGFDAGGRVTTPDDALNHLLGSIGSGQVAGRGVARGALGEVSQHDGGPRDAGPAGQRAGLRAGAAAASGPRGLSRDRDEPQPALRTRRA